MILHGDGCASANHEYLARHLASRGFMAAIPASTASYDHDTLLSAGLKSPQKWLPGLAGKAAGGKGVVFCHSMGAERTLQLLSASSQVQAMVFMGPVYTTTSRYGQSLFPVQGLVIGGSEDGQSGPSYYETVYEQFDSPRYTAVLQGGDHSQFTDDKHWEGTPNPAVMARNRQFELVQSLSPACLQRVYGQAEPFAAWLTPQGVPAEVVLQSQP